MTKLKLGSIADDKPVKMMVELPARLHRDLIIYAEVLASETGRSTTDPVRLIVPMLERFIASDREFRRKKRHMQDVAAQSDSGVVRLPS